tara:strand:- start:1526 stop:2686 length:1161 start_codon:yes stop_codon:yes gene_type:complete
MEAIKARKTIKDNELINKKKSKEIINFIKNKKKKLSFKINKNELNKIEKIRKEYNSTKRRAKSIVPRNLIFYEIIKKRYKDFSWSKINKHYDIKFDTKNLNQRVTLASLLLEKVTKNIEPKSIKNKKNILIKKFLESDIFVKINLENKKLFFELINSLNKYDELVIVSPVCPDYSAIKKAPGIYEFTFKKLNSGIGVITEKLLENLDKIHSFFKSIDVQFKHVVAIGDFEALSKDILRNLNINEEKFISKLRISQKKLLKATKFKIEVPLFTEIDGGLDNWKKIYKHNYSKLKKNNYGKSKINKKIISEIAQSRLKLYEKWFKNITKKRLNEIILKQGAEYTSMGDMVTSKYKNSLIIGADHFRMSDFYKVNSPTLPVLYLKNNYK